MATPMKNGLDQAAIQRIASAFRAVSDDFPQQAFIQQGVKGVQPLALRQRVDFLIRLLNTFLPQDFVQTATLLEQIPVYWDAGQKDDPLRHFAAWPVIDYVAVYGLQHPQRSLSVLKRLTLLYSAEFAIRPFLIQHRDLTLKQLHSWCDDTDHHVRRLVSEGTRPRLPWGKQLKPFMDNPLPVFALLEQLKDDPSDYVRRSVANNLNDIAKDHPQLVIDRCQAWQQPNNPRRNWIIRHACRTLVKNGYTGVYGLLGYTETPQVDVHSLQLSPMQVFIGEALTFHFTVQSTATSRQKMVIDYAIHHRKANGQTSAKVFKLKNIQLAAGEAMTLSKKHSFRVVTTRTYYAGMHQVDILLNGEVVVRRGFELQVSCSS